MVGDDPEVAFQTSNRTIALRVRRRQTPLLVKDSADGVHVVRDPLGHRENGGHRLPLHGRASPPEIPSDRGTIVSLDQVRIGKPEVVPYSTNQSI